MSGAGVVSATQITLGHKETDHLPCSRVPTFFQNQLLVLCAPPIQRVFKHTV